MKKKKRESRVWLYDEYVEDGDKIDNSHLEGHYQIELVCLNCGHDIMVWIKKGISVDKVKKEIKCTGCGCFTIEHPMKVRERLLELFIGLG